jgi:hypothetical protein
MAECGPCVLIAPELVQLYTDSILLFLISMNDARIQTKEENRELAAEDWANA